MTEQLLWVYPQPEEPPESIIVIENDQEKVIATEDLWAHSGDAMRYQPPTNEEQGEQ
jgi:hypothetical protein